MNNYIELALKTETKDYETISKRYTPEIARLMHATNGLTTEAGELLDMFKKHINYGKDFDKVNAIEELGDIFWYLAIACDCLGVSFDEVMQKNIDKLKARYGDKYSDQKAIERDLEAERTVLEKKGIVSIPIKDSGLLTKK